MSRVTNWASCHKLFQGKPLGPTVPLELPNKACVNFQHPRLQTGSSC